AAATARCLCLAMLAALAACAEPEHDEGGQVTVEAPLPAPRQPGGAITDMPEAPGPGEVPLGGSPPPPPPAELPVDAFGLPRWKRIRKRGWVLRPTPRICRSRRSRTHRRPGILATCCVAITPRSTRAISRARRPPGRKARAPGSRRRSSRPVS